MTTRIKVSEEGKKQLLSARQGITDQQWCEIASGGTMLASGCSKSTLRKLLAGNAINDEAFKSFCRAVNLNWELVALQSDNNFDYWVGRQNTIAELSTKLSDASCLLLTGISGIGKTALAYQVSRRFPESKYSEINFEDDDRLKFEPTAVDLLL